jgi:hypothetical protein
MSSTSITVRIDFLLHFAELKLSFLTSLFLKTAKIIEIQSIDQISISFICLLSKQEIRTSFLLQIDTTLSSVSENKICKT